MSNACISQCAIRTLAQHTQTESVAVSVSTSFLDELSSIGKTPIDHFEKAHSQTQDRMSVQLPFISIL
jgi:hypothetical protein